VGNSVKGLTKVQVDNTHSLSLIHWVGHLNAAPIDAVLSRNTVDSFNASEKHAEFTELCKLDASARKFMSIQHRLLKSNAIKAHVLFNPLSAIHYTKSSSPQEAHHAVLGLLYNSIGHAAPRPYLNVGEECSFLRGQHLVTN